MGIWHIKLIKRYYSTWSLSKGWKQYNKIKYLILNYVYNFFHLAIRKAPESETGAREVYSLLMNHSVANCAYGVFYSLSLLWHYRMLIHAWNGTCCTVLDKLLFSCFTPPTFFFPQMNIHLSCFTSLLFHQFFVLQ